jgi:hypothetical protein
MLFLLEIEPRSSSPSIYRRREYKPLQNSLISTIYEQHQMLKHKRCEFDSKGKSVWQKYLSAVQRVLNACGINISEIEFHICIQNFYIIMNISYSFV